VNAEPLQGQSKRMSHFAVPPDADVHDLLFGVRHEVDIDVLIERLVGHSDSVVEQGDTPVAAAFCRYSFSRAKKRVLPMRNIRRLEERWRYFVPSTRARSRCATDG